MGKVVSAANLQVSFPGTAQRKVVQGVSFDIHAGELLALAGESGCGKTMLCRALLGLPPKGAQVSYELLERPAPAAMSLVMQDAMTALDPAMPVGKQITEACRSHPPDPVALLTRVGIDNASLRVRQYPGAFSGGMRQRAAIAVALAMRPQLIVADEPTTSLDADMRLKIMALLHAIRQDGTAMLFVTHDLGLVRDFADRVLIMKDGQIIEQGATAALFSHPQEAYTKELIRHAAVYQPDNHVPSKPRRPDADRRQPPALVAVKGLTKRYALGRGQVKSVLRDIDMAVYAGEIAGLFGPSGMGKSTLARCLAGLEKPSSGQRVMQAGLSIQMIFQDSASALNPRMTVAQLIAEPLYLRDKKRPSQQTILALMKDTELEPTLLTRRPRELSGGQRQRVAIARAIATRPGLIIADEPVSSLDAATCSKIIHLLKRLKEEYQLTLLLISHDLGLLTHISDRIIRLTSDGVSGE